MLHVPLSSKAFQYWYVIISHLSRIAEKDKQIKQMEDSLGNEHANLTSKEEELKV